MEKKEIPVPCKMFLRFLKEKGAFHDWRVEGEKRVRWDFNSPHGHKFCSLADKWQWYVSHSSVMHGIILSNRIYNVIDKTLYWTRTKRGHYFWSNLHIDWMGIYETYHAKREMDRAAGKPITDDLETFRKVLGAFFHNWRHRKLFAIFSVFIFGIFQLLQWHLGL